MVAQEQNCRNRHNQRPFQGEFTPVYKQVCIPCQTLKYLVKVLKGVMKAKLENLISKLNFYKLIPYLVDRCICPAPCRSRQTLEKNVLSWSLAGTGSVLFTRQVAV